MKYTNYKLSELKEIAKNLKLKGYSKLNKEDLISLIKKSNKLKSGGALISYNNIKDSQKSINNKIKNILNSNNPDYIKKELINHNGNVFLNSKQTKTEILKKLSNNNPKNKNKILKIKEKLIGAPLNNFVKYKLLDWIPIEKLDWSKLSENPNAIYLLEANKDKIDWTGLSSNPSPRAIHLLETNKDKIHWYGLSRNPNAIHLLETNEDKIYWETLSRNPNAIYLLEENLDKIDWRGLSFNPNAINLLEANKDNINWTGLSGNPSPGAIHLLEENLDKIDWRMLSENPSPGAIHLLEKNLDKIDWYSLSRNPNAIHLLEKNLDKINWWCLSLNPNAIHLIEANFDEIDWWCLSKNPNAIHLLEANQYKIDWERLSQNPSIFKKVYNYGKMKKARNNTGISENIIAKGAKPRKNDNWKSFVKRQEELGFNVNYNNN
jgi:hypothetical protein